MDITGLVLLLSLFIVFYTYAGYGLVVWFILKIRSLYRKSPAVPPSISYPRVTLVVPSYNEEDFIRQKIKNTLSLEYPVDELEIIFITDGSTDRTPGIIREFPRVKLMHSDERKGKIAAMNRAMKEITSPIVVFCDANTLLNEQALKEIVKHYGDPKVGGVAGEKKVLDLEESNTAGVGESLYWKYESTLKKLDSDFYTVVGAAGELFSFRTELFEEIAEDTLLDDFIISLRICQKGYRVIYESGAYAMEKPSSSIREEQKRKVRISAGAFQSIVRLRSLLNIFRYPVLSFQYISRRVLRWAICPFLLPLIFILNLVLVVRDYGNLFFVILFLLQSVFYLFALIGWRLSVSGRKAGVFNFPFYFVFMNASLYLGLARFIKGNQSVMWEKAKRKV